MPWRDWIRTIEVEPSIYGADFANLGDQIEALLRSECRVFHFDAGDGHFIEPIPLGEEWPQYAHPGRPEFLLTRPDRDRTSGFFIARLRVP